MKQEAEAAEVSITSIATRHAFPVRAALPGYQNSLVRHLRPEACQELCNSQGWVVASSARAEFQVARRGMES